MGGWLEGSEKRASESILNSNAETQKFQEVIPGSGNDIIGAYAVCLVRD